NFFRQKAKTNTRFYEIDNSFYGVDDRFMIIHNVMAYQPSFQSSSEKATLIKHNCFHKRLFQQIFKIFNKDWRYGDNTLVINMDLFQLFVVYRRGYKCCV